MDRDSRLIFERYKAYRNSRMLQENQLTLTQGGGYVLLAGIASIAASFGLVSLADYLNDLADKLSITSYSNVLDENTAVTQFLQVAQKSIKELTAAASAQDYDRFQLAGQQIGLLLQDTPKPLTEFGASAGSIILKSLQGFEQTKDLLYLYACAKTLGFGLTQLSTELSSIETFPPKVIQGINESAQKLQNIANQLVDQFGNPIQSAAAATPAAAAQQQTSSSPGPSPGPSPTPPPNKWKDRAAKVAKAGLEKGGNALRWAGKEIWNLPGNAARGYLNLYTIVYKTTGWLGAITFFFAPIPVLVVAAISVWTAWKSLGGFGRAGESIGDTVATTAAAAEDLADATKTATQATEDATKTADSWGRSIPAKMESMWESTVGWLGSWWDGGDPDNSDNTTPTTDPSAAATPPPKTKVVDPNTNKTNTVNPDTDLNFLNLTNFSSTNIAPKRP
jgi:hypothetical protein